MRERVEDLGRLAEMLRQATINPIWDADEDARFSHLNIDDREEIDKLFAQLNQLYELIAACYDVARWGDDGERL